MTKTEAELRRALKACQAALREHQLQLKCPTVASALEGADKALAHPTPVVRRMWINQPSSAQPFHDKHGTNVLAHYERDGTMRIYYLSGETISSDCSPLALSDGWKAPRKTASAYEEA